MMRILKSFGVATLALAALTACERTDPSVVQNLTSERDSLKGELESTRKELEGAKTEAQKAQTLDAENQALKREIESLTTRIADLEKERQTRVLPRSNPVVKKPTVQNPATPRTTTPVPASSGDQKSLREKLTGGSGSK